MGDDGPSDPANQDQSQAPTPPQGEKGSSGQHRYEVGPGFEIAVRGEQKHPVEVNVSKDGDSEHRHAAVDRRLEHVERSVGELAARLAQVEAALKLERKIA